ncbi:MAG: aminoacyl-tRNA hydrolase [Pseudobdellovibrionaceae bacterium]|nr:aminoacyl-tRNA hydrolase [Bdellovibrionales bacterium]USN48542.1 MAG: aminoacyl-tRNA hydrolase [Pseudobdellovibrionaceae bacterium]
MKISPKELNFTFSKSSGAGGQNVNKVNTKVTLRWNIFESSSVSQKVIDRFCELFPNKILDDGTVQISSQRYRLQARNIADCVEKLHVMIEKAARPKKPRRPTKPTTSSVEKRLKGKRLQSDKKRQRQGRDD